MIKVAEDEFGEGSDDVCEIVEVFQSESEEYTSFSKPFLCPAADALPDAVKGNLPTLISFPVSLAAASVIPTDAISGLA